MAHSQPLWFLCKHKWKMPYGIGARVMDIEAYDAEAFGYFLLVWPFTCRMRIWIPSPIKNGFFASIEKTDSFVGSGEESSHLNESDLIAPWNWHCLHCSWCSFYFLPRYLDVIWELQLNALQSTIGVDFDIDVSQWVKRSTNIVRGLELLSIRVKVRTREPHLTRDDRCPFLPEKEPKI